MSVKINRVYVQNYKLFEEKTICFADGLSVFDGPNGYGKTSIFDAVEFLITGKIDRVEKSDVISGIKSYSSNFLAKDSKKDVFIKGEFFDSEQEKVLIIALQIPAMSVISKKLNNPKNVCESAQAYVLGKFDLPFVDWGKPVSKQVIKEIRTQFFGSQNIEFYKNIHYVQQEDRLAYFKNSEQNRITEINRLFGIEYEETALQKTESLSRQLSAKIKKVNEEIALLATDVKLIQENIIKEVDYVELLDGKQAWDKRNLGFKGATSKALYEKYITELRALSVLAEFKDTYILDTEMRAYEEIPFDKRTVAIKAWALEERNKEIFKRYYVINRNLKFFKEQMALAEQQNYKEINYQKICDVLELNKEKVVFQNILQDLNSSLANETGLQKSISKLIELRNNLRSKSKSVDGWSNNTCPYCGQVWNDVDELDKKFCETERLIQESIGRENLAAKKYTNTLKTEFENKCLALIQGYISEYQKNEVVELFNDVKELEQLRALAFKCEPILKRLNNKNEIELAWETDDYSYKNYAEIVLSETEKIKRDFSAEYLNASSRYGFDELYRSYFAGKNKLSFLDKEKIDLKIRYIQNQFNASFDETIKKLNELCIQKEQLDTLKNEINVYKDALKYALNSYRDKVVKQIEVPFFLYSSRLLQSYQSGQGVMIQSSGESIRFCVPGGEHDVLYTMSSGQLSAVLLSFSLALNKIYAGEKFNTLLIDDPIQCMDDINMLSFVELLRQEFNGIQIIMSTHEDTFSNFIRYKFGKFNKKCTQINLHG